MYVCRHVDGCRSVGLYVCRYVCTYACVYVRVHVCTRGNLNPLVSQVVLLPSLLIYRVASALSDVLALCTLSPDYIAVHTAGIYATEVPTSPAEGAPVSFATSLTLAHAQTIRYTSN